MGLALSFDEGVAIVAGGSGGIGSAICRGFANAGISVVFTYNNSEERAKVLKADIAASGVACEYQHVNLSHPNEAKRLIKSVQERYGRIGHIVYAAGPHFDFNYIGSIPDDEWHAVVNADINGAFHLIQSAVRVFREQGDGGNLLAVITTAVERVPIKDIMSAAPKAAIEMIMRGVAKESGRFGIRANCVGPGWIDAGLGAKAFQEKLDEKTREHVRTSSIPLRRFGNADDVANAALFLCSRQANYITGQSVAVDGGLQL
jgi:NAD(P)-dependent dehydrogenase (short-subunit alcohol dehydrogenase family)